MSLGKRLRGSMRDIDFGFELYLRPNEVDELKVSANMNGSNEFEFYAVQNYDINNIYEASVTITKDQAIKLRDYLNYWIDKSE